MKSLSPRIPEILAIYDTLHNLSHDELRAKSRGFRDIIAEDLKGLDTERDKMQTQLDNEPDMDPVEKDALFHVIAIFAFSSIWLVGYYIYQYRSYFYADRNAALFCLGILPLISRMHFTDNFYDPFKYFMFSLFAIPFLRYCLQIPYSGFKIKLSYLVIPHLIIVACALTIRYLPLKNALAYSTLPYVYWGLGYLLHRSKAKQKIINLVNKSGAILGKHSYALYISHFPIVFIFSLLIHNIALYILVTLPVVAVVTYLLENKLQPFAMRYLSKGKTSAGKNEEFKIELATAQAAV